MREVRSSLLGTAANAWVQAPHFVRLRITSPSQQKKKKNHWELRKQLFATIISQLTNLRQGAGFASHGGNTCSICTQSLCEWVLKIERAVTPEPNWRAFATAYRRCSEQRCDCKRPMWPIYFKRKLPEWEGRVKTAEASIPAWPFK